MTLTNLEGKASDDNAQPAQEINLDAVLIIMSFMHSLDVRRDSRINKTWNAAATKTLEDIFEQDEQEAAVLWHELWDEEDRIRKEELMRPTCECKTRSMYPWEYPCSCGNVYDSD